MSRIGQSPVNLQENVEAILENKLDIVPKLNY